MVFDDADLDAAVVGAVAGSLINTGQDCTAATRAIVARELYDDFVAGVAEVMGRVVVGDPHDPETDLGPLITAAHREKVAAMVARAPAQGGRVFTGGSAPDLPGWFYRPTLIADVGEDSEVYRDEIFGPVLTVRSFTDDDDALWQANDTDYGLAASAWTRDVYRAQRASREINAGCVWINDHIPIISEMPHGGVGASGFGKDMSDYSLEEYLTVKHVMSDITGVADKEWHRTIFASASGASWAHAKLGNAKGRAARRVGRFCVRWAGLTRPSGRRPLGRRRRPGCARLSNPERSAAARRTCWNRRRAGRRRPTSFFSADSSVVCVVVTGVQRGKRLLAGCIATESVSKRSVLDLGHDREHARRRVRGTAAASAGRWYRLTGTVADAEDVVQDAWLRWDRSGAAVDDLRAWLTTVVSRLALDRLRSAAHRRETYYGEWLPEPVVTALDGDDPLAAVVAGEDARFAAMVVLERLNPDQRVAFVLHDGFAVPFGEIASVLGVSDATARQLASRARRAVSTTPPPVAEDVHNEVAGALMLALSAGDMEAVVRLLHPEVTFTGDSNRMAPTAARVIHGPDKVARFLFGLANRYGPDFRRHHSWPRSTANSAATSSARRRTAAIRR